MAASFWSEAWFWALLGSTLYLAVFVFYMQHRDYERDKEKRTETPERVQFRAGDFLVHLVTAAVR